MLGQYLITFREALEAALITSIVLAYLSRTGRSYLSKFIWYGVLSATAASVVLGAAVWFGYGELSESVRQLFEGIAALIAVVVLTMMIYWMATKGKKLGAEVEKRVESMATRRATFGLCLLRLQLFFANAWKLYYFSRRFS